MPFTNITTDPISHVEWLGPNGLAAFCAKTLGCRSFTWVGTGNDTWHRFDIGADENIDQYDRARYDAAKEDGMIDGYEMRALLLGLIADGHMPAGDYLIHVSW